MKLKELFNNAEKKYLDADIVWYAQTHKTVGAIILDSKYYVILKESTQKVVIVMQDDGYNAKYIKYLHGLWYGYTHNGKRKDDIWYEDKEQMKEVEEQIVVESI